MNCQSGKLFQAKSFVKMRGVFLAAGLHIARKLQRNINSSLLSRIVSCYHTDHGVYGCRSKTHKEAWIEDPTKTENRIRQSNLYRLVNAYREHGHKRATLDPLDLRQPSLPEELELHLYGLQGVDEHHPLVGILNVPNDSATTGEVLQLLKQLYCGSISAEFLHVQTLEEREWFAARYEQMVLEQLTDPEKVQLAKLLLRSQAYDHFLANKFSTVKRYGGEGAESAMGFYDELFKMAANMNVSDVIIGIAHRGRLNLLTCLLKFPPVAMFRKMKGKREFPDDVVGAGDVLSHLTSSVDLNYGDNNVHVTMMPNPSHLEAVNPVTMGKARAREMSLGAGDYASTEHDADARPGDRVLCFQIHGDAAFSAQGVVAETFTLADTPHFTIGGSMHLIINNQIGFTTGTERGRSSLYCSDIGKMNGCPVIHVNGDYPEEVVKACRIAMEYREKFRKDVLVDLHCFRKYGHNEIDDPTYTQPIMYKAIDNRQSIPDLYAQTLTEQGLVSKEELNQVVQDWTAELNKHLKGMDSYVPKAYHLEKQWSGLVQAPPSLSRWDTGVNVELLKYVGAQSVTLPVDLDLDIHSNVRKTHIDRRLERLEKGAPLDWATAEAVAMGSLLHQGFNVRISGQDVGRGTFSHRHAMLVDQETDEAYVPLNHMFDDQTGFLEVANSALTEEAVLGYEYGVSVETPKLLAIWEAQFGDFFNGAQIMIDTFVTGGETKWLLQSGLVILLPHGIDGAGPEHSSCHIERFLQACDSKEDAADGDDVNIQIANPTIPAQYFHLLRRQMVRNFRKPLIMAAPKVLIRHPSATSLLTDMAPGTMFHPVLADPNVSNPQNITRVVLVCGKHFYTLDKERAARGVQNTAIIRLEELCPFPVGDIRKELAKFPNATDFVWSQEEHRNQGAWSFVSPRFENILGKKLRYVGRAVHPTPATGVGEIHQQEAKQILDDTFAV